MSIETLAAIASPPIHIQRNHGHTYSSVLHKIT